MNDNFDISKWNRRIILENIEIEEAETEKKKDEFLKAEDNLYKKVTGEEPKKSTKNKVRNVKEIKQNPWNINLDDDGSYYIFSVILKKEYYSESEIQVVEKKIEELLNSLTNNEEIYE